MTNPQWKLNLFGGLQLVAPDGTVFVTKAKRANSLLAYLALCPGGNARRKSLAAQLFEEDDLEPNANFALLITRLASSLKKHSALPVLWATRDEVGLDLGSVQVDAQLFLEEVAEAQVEANPVKKGAILLSALERLQGAILPETRPSMLLPLIEPLEVRALVALTLFAELPVARQYSNVVQEKLLWFEPKAKFDPMVMEHVLRIYGGLGLTDKLVQVFSDYESWMQDEYGEPPREALVRLFQSLMDGTSNLAVSDTHASERPAFSVGRDNEFSQIKRHLGSDGGHRLLTLVGLSGIGKSHLLKESFWQLRGELRAGYFDLDYAPYAVVRAAVQDGHLNVLMLDEAGRAHAGFIEELLQEHRELRILAASHQRLGLQTELILIVQPLATEYVSDPGVQFVDRLVGDKGQSQVSTDDRAPLRLELAQLCEGIPLALQIAAKLASSVGLAATVMTLRRGVPGVSSQSRGKERHHSLGQAILGSYAHLSEGAKLAVLLVASNGSRLPSDLVIFSASIQLEDLEEAILSGLLYEEEDLFVRIPQAASEVIVATEFERLEATRKRFTEAICSWFIEQGKEQPTDMRLAAAMPSCLQVMGQLMRDERWAEAMDLFIAIRPWFGSFKLTSEQFELLECLGAKASSASTEEELAASYLPYNRLSETEPNVGRFNRWAQVVLGLGIVYFHANFPDRMLEVVGSGLRNPRFSDITVREQATMLLHVGIAHRMLKQIDIAERYFRESAALGAKVPGDHLTAAWSNLAMLMEFGERLEEAKQAYEESVKYFSINTDPRLKSMILCALGRLMYRLSGDLDGAQYLMVSAVNDALEQNNKRGAAHILQSLGYVYAEKGLHRNGAYADALGTAMLLEFGYDPNFRQLSRSALVTLSASLFKLGKRSLGFSARVLVDRLGDTELYEPVKPYYDYICSMTFRTPDLKRPDVASEHEVKAFLQRSLAELKALGQAEGELPELSPLLQAYGA